MAVPRAAFVISQRDPCNEHCKADSEPDRNWIPRHCVHPSSTTGETLDRFDFASESIIWSIVWLSMQGPAKAVEVMQLLIAA